MRQQIWTVGSRYMIPTHTLLKSGSSASSLVDFKEHLKQGGEIVMATSINLDKEPAIINSEMFIDLNNNTITGGLFGYSNDNVVEGNTDSYAFWVKKGGELIIDGDGIVKTQSADYAMAVWAQGGTVIINGGKFYNEGEGSDLIYASAGGKVYIYGGEFYPNKKQEGVDGTANPYSALNIKDIDRGISEIKVYGGKFYNFDPANNLSEGPNTSFVAEGYKSVEIEPNVWEVVKE